MKKKYITLLSAIVISTSAPLVGLADTIDSQIKDSDNKIETLKEKKKSSEEKLKQLDEEIKGLDKKVEVKLTEKVSLEKELYDLNLEIDGLTEAIEKRTEKISEQARATQVNQSGHTYLEVVLASDNLSEAITRSLAYGKLVQANNNIALAQKHDKEELVIKETEVDNKIKKVQEVTEELKKQQDAVNTKKYDQAILAKQVEADLTKEESKKDKLLKEKAEAEKRKIEAEKQALEEAKQREMATAAARENSDTGGGGAPGNASKPPVRKGDFQWPIPSIHITSGYGGRNDPTGSSGTHHDGIDMAGSLNDHIHASRDGVVVATGFQSSAGNHVIIQHDNGYYTYYLHLNKIGTSVGSKVNAGEVIGYMGTTGNSTGVHLHFGISTGIWNGFLDPGPFLGLY